MVLNFGKVAAGLPSPFLFLLLASLVTAGSSGLPSGGLQMGEKKKEKAHCSRSQSSQSYQDTYQYIMSSLG